MGIIKRIHHIELITKSLDSLSDYLIKSFGFNAIFSKTDERVLRSGNATFIAKSMPNFLTSQIDSVYDIALEVVNVQDIINYANDNNIPILKAKERIVDNSGYVDVAQIKSCVGNVVHTIINKDNYKGSFFPGYCIDPSKCDQNGQLVTRFDHVAYAVKKNSSKTIIKWYSDVFGMQRMLVNKKDLIDDGFVFHHKNSGMRLKAFDYYKCEENCIGNNDDSCKFVIAEELDDNAENQIGTFLREHEIAGIQHVGLYVDDIVRAAEICTDNGAQFLIPPIRYYDIINRNTELIKYNLCLAPFKKTGILIDAESESNSDGDSPNEGLLFQIFTKPVFDRNTFFLELIQRQGARGFGSGNIKALWDAVEYSLTPSSDQVSEKIGYK